MRWGRASLYTTTAFNFEHVNDVITSRSYWANRPATVTAEWCGRTKRCWSRRIYNWIIIVEGTVKYVSEMSSTLPANENEVIYRFSFGMLFSHFLTSAWRRDVWRPTAVAETFNCSRLSVYLSGDEDQRIICYKEENVRLDNKLRSLQFYKLCYVLKLSREIRISLGDCGLD
jgi:hypothetical protein